MADIESSVKEVARIAKLGYRSCKIPISVKAHPYNLPMYEPLWSAFEDTTAWCSLFMRLPPMKISTRKTGDEKDGYGGALDFMAMRMADGMGPVSQLISGGVLQRHPKLNFVVVECGAGWLAWLLYVLDEQNEKKHMWIHPRLEMRPSEFFAETGSRHVWRRSGGPKDASSSPGPTVCCGAAIIRTTKVRSRTLKR